MSHCVPLRKYGSSAHQYEESCLPWVHSSVQPDGISGWTRYQSEATKCNKGSLAAYCWYTGPQGDRPQVLASQGMSSFLRQGYTTLRANALASLFNDAFSNTSNSKKSLNDELGCNLFENITPEFLEKD
jgi:hypothetical protein